MEAQGREDQTGTSQPSCRSGPHRQVSWACLDVMKPGRVIAPLLIQGHAQLPQLPREAVATQVSKIEERQEEGPEMEEGPKMAMLGEIPMGSPHPLPSCSLSGLVCRTILRSR
jgi:hypothetical protein